MLLHLGSFITSMPSTHVASIYANLLEQKRLQKKSQFNSRKISWNTNMAAISLFWKINMVAVTSCENALFSDYHFHYVYHLHYIYLFH